MPGSFPSPGAIAAATQGIPGFAQGGQPPPPPAQTPPRGFFGDFGRGFTSDAGPFKLENPNFASVLGHILGNSQMQIGNFSLNTAGGGRARLMQKLMALMNQPQAAAGSGPQTTLRIGGNTAGIDATSIVP